LKIIVGGIATRIGLITIITDEIEPMKRFYRDVLGFVIKEDLGNHVEFENQGLRFAVTTSKVMLDGTGHPSYRVKATGQRFELAFPVESPEQVDIKYRELVNKGASQVRAPELMPWGRRTAFVSDPDGNIHEIYSLRPGEKI